MVLFLWGFFFFLLFSVVCVCFTEALKFDGRGRVIFVQLGA